jgi:periplasmic protein TonB
MGLRIPIALLLASLVTFGLFWAMQALISSSAELREGTTPRSVEFVRLRRDTEVETRKREPPKREKPEQPPPPPEITASQARLDQDAGFAAIVPIVDASDALSGGISAGGGSDRDAVPLVRIEPEYPMRARQRGIEGWVALEFTVTPTGAVRDPRVVRSHPGSVFDAAALQAVRKWKYNPKVENGVAVARERVQVLLDFSMDD